MCELSDIYKDCQLGKGKIMVYVDWLMNHGWILRGHSIKSCHMIADSDKELNEMALKIGMKASWLQTNKSWFHHYDLIESRRKLAVSFGVQELNRKAFTKIYKKRRSNANTRKDG